MKKTIKTLLLFTLLSGLPGPAHPAVNLEAGSGVTVVETVRRPHKTHQKRRPGAKKGRAFLGLDFLFSISAIFLAAGIPYYLSLVWLLLPISLSLTVLIRHWNRRQRGAKSPRALAVLGWIGLAISVLGLLAGSVY